MNELLEQFSQPFPPEAITWKPGNTTKDGTKCMAMAYGDLREYMKRLDEVCGLDWSCKYVPWGNDRIMCELTISGVTRTSTGEFGAQDEKNNIEGTVAEAQAFKRACAMFGLGRYLYDLPSVWVAYDKDSRKIAKEGQAELDRRYREWYQKTMAAHKTTPRQVEPSTGEIIDALTSGPLASPDQLRRLNEIGLEYYKAGWPVAIEKWIIWATDAKAGTPEQLNPEQADAIIEAIEKRIAKRLAEVEAA